MSAPAASRSSRMMDESSLLALLKTEAYFSREQRLASLASLLAGLAWSFALIFLPVSPFQGMQPLVVMLGGFWFRYSLVGDLSLLIVCLRHRAVINNPIQRLMLDLVALLALLHALVSWRDPWGIIWSNILIDWLLLISLPLVLLPWLRAAGGRLAWALLGGSWLLAGAAALFGFAAHGMFLLTVIARRLIVKLFSGVWAAEAMLWFRWAMVLSALLAIGLVLLIRQRRDRLDPGLLKVRKKALLDQKPSRGWRRFMRLFACLLCLSSGPPGLSGAEGTRDIQSALGDAQASAEIKAAFSRLGKTGLRYELMSVTNLPQDEQASFSRALHGRDAEIASQIRAALATNGFEFAKNRLPDLSRDAPWLSHLLLGELFLRAGQKDRAIRAFTDCIKLYPGESRAWEGLEAAGHQAVRIVFRQRASAVRVSSKHIMIRYDETLKDPAARFAWISYALARALYRYEGMWRSADAATDWYTESMDEYIFAWRVLAESWRTRKKTPGLKPDSFLERITQLDAAGLLPGFVWFECWHPPSLLHAERARLRFAQSLERYCSTVIFGGRVSSIQ